MEPLAEGVVLPLAPADPGADESLWQGNDWARHMIHRKAYRPGPALRSYPAQLRFGLMPQWRRRGLMRQSVGFLVGQLQVARIAGAHVPVERRNQAGQRFCTELGFAAMPGPRGELTDFWVQSFGSTRNLQAEGVPFFVNSASRRWIRRSRRSSR